MVRLYLDERMLDHEPPGRHPERPERLQAVIRHLARVGLRPACKVGVVRPATREELERVHGPEYLEALSGFAGAGGGQIESDTWMSPGSLLAAELAAGAAIEAVDQVLTRDDPLAFCAIRPPGHHARPFAPMGFCLYGNIAVAAAHALERHGLDRLLIVDWDVHHGNGTQEVFDADPRVGFLSIHRFPFYPGTGRADETGTGAGLGTKVNLPIRYGTPRTDFVAAFRAGVERLADRIRPQLILVSAGFDAHEADPVGDLGLETEDFTTLTEIVHGLAKTHCGGRIVSVLEGGYNPAILAGCVAAHLEALGVEPVSKA